MKPLKLSIKVDAADHFIYNGKLYIALSDGGIVAVSLTQIFELIKEKYVNIDGIDGILNLSFRRNLYWNTQPVRSFTNIPTVRDALLKVWDRIGNECTFEIDISELRTEMLLKDFPSEILDMSIYGQSVYLACLNGLYQINLEKNNWQNKKKFDAKTYSINTGYCNVILSLGSDGISHYNPFVESHVKDCSNRKGESITTRWTPAGSLMNYIDASTLEFLSNRIVKLSNSNPERDQYAIASFAEASDFIEKFINNDYKELFQKRVLVFNGTNKQYMLTEEGFLFDGKLDVRKGKLSSIGLKKYTEISNPDYGDALSGKEVAGYPIVEFENSVCLFQNDNSYILEEDPVVSIHTYPKSSHFRDIVSITTDECVNIHSLDVLSNPCPEVHPQVSRHRRETNGNDETYVPIIESKYSRHVDDSIAIQTEGNDLPF